MQIYYCLASGQVKRNIDRPGTMDLFQIFNYWNDFNKKTNNVPKWEHNVDDGNNLC